MTGRDRVIEVATGGNAADIARNTIGWMQDCLC